MPELSPAQKGGIAALCIAAAGACLSLTKASEGQRLKPYRDPANIVTWCYGETEGKAKASYTSAECATLLQNRLASSYAPQLAKCLPQLGAEKRIKVFAALLDASYNAGTVAVCQSPMAAKISAGDFAGSCSAFVSAGALGSIRTHGWFTTARYRGKPMPADVMRAHGWVFTIGAWRKELPGLVTRRSKEAALCFEGAQ